MANDSSNQAKIGENILPEKKKKKNIFKHCLIKHIAKWLKIELHIELLLGILQVKSEINICVHR